MPPIATQELQRRDSTRMGWTEPRSLAPIALRVHGGLARIRSTAMPRTSAVYAVTTIGIDMGKNTLHMIGLDTRGGIVLRAKVPRGRITSRLASLRALSASVSKRGWRRTALLASLPCLATIEAGPARVCRSRFGKGHKNDFRDAHAVAEAVQRSRRPLCSSQD